MNVLEFVEDINSADIVAYLLCLGALCRYLLTGDNDGTLYLTTVALFFFGISFIIDAINELNIK
jgi:hypothetical protein